MELLDLWLAEELRPERVLATAVEVPMRPGDMVKFRRIDRDEYDDLQASAEAEQYRITARDVEFDLQPFLEDPDGYNKRLLEVLA